MDTPGGRRPIREQAQRELRAEIDSYRARATASIHEAYHRSLWAGIVATQAALASDERRRREAV